MTRTGALLGAMVLTVAAQADLRGDHGVAPAASANGLPLPASGAAAGQVERHHYTIGARVRPLLVFWIARSGVGDAVVTRRRAPGEASYSLLIGSDPDRTPMHINRWGYIEEEIRGAEARLLGLMTESEEDSIQEAEANLRKQSSGSHPFKVIHATADGEQAQARVVSINMPEDYTLRQMRVVLDVAQRAASGGTLRLMRLPPGTRPGFLAALADAMRMPTERSIAYAYYGKLYELRRTRSRDIPNLQIAQRAYGPAVAADFVITSAHDGEQTKFSMTYGTHGAFAEIPLTVTYQPRWWMQVELTIDEASDALALDSGAAR
jgi:hypothetical protein